MAFALSKPIGEPTEIAGSVVFLANRAFAFTAGQAIFR
jgi:hypothetical protein